MTEVDILFGNVYHVMTFKTFHISTCYLFFLHCIMQILQVKIPWTDLDKDTHLS